MLEELRHPNIVEMIDVDRDPEGNWYLVLEWVPENLEDIVNREGSFTWPSFWDRFGCPLLEGIICAQKRKIAHRDIKPKNILVTEAGAPKIADYGIAKLLDTAGAWAPVAGETFRFDRTPGYTPPEPDDSKYSLSRDCYAFAAVAVSCIIGRALDSDDDLFTGLQEAVLPKSIRPILERCLSTDPAQRPPLASVLAADIERAQADELRSLTPAVPCHLVLSHKVKVKLEGQVGTEDRSAIERFIVDELSEACALILPDSPDAEGTEITAADLVGVTWRFRVAFSGRLREHLELVWASEIGASLAAELRDRGLRRPLRLSFDKPRDPEIAGQQIRLLISEASEFQRDLAAEREARASQRIFRVWRSYLRDRADLESKRSNAISYVDRRAGDDRIVFTTEIAQSEELVDQERLVQHTGGRLTGRVTAVAFNQITLDVTHGEPAKVPRRGELSMNTIAAQRALDHQNAALNMVFYDRGVSSNLKPIILTPRVARPVNPVDNVTAKDDDLDDEKKVILAKALGVSDVLAIEGPPGTGKTKLITEILVQWLQRHPNDRILLSSQTHIALDNVLERVTDLEPSLDIIRIGRLDEPRISELSQGFLLERRVETWIADVRASAEEEMTRWAEDNNVDRETVMIGMNVERLLQVLSNQKQLREHIARHESERKTMEQGANNGEGEADRDELDEETAQIDSEIGAYRQALKLMKDEEGAIRTQMLDMGSYAAELSRSSSPEELEEWAKHFLTDEPAIVECRERLRLLEDWLLRVGRSSDFNAAMLASAQIIAGTCVGIAGVKGMEEVAYDLCIIDEASKATATEILIPMSRSRRWIIVGDPKQLPPFFEEFGEQIKSEFDSEEMRSTLLDRFLDERDGLPAGCRAALRNQYRMIEPIGDLVSQCFYSGQLENPVKSHGLKLAIAIPKPVTWYSTHRLDDRFERPEGQTFSNATEAGAIRDVLRRLQFVAKAQKRRISVAVITGYTAQVRILTDMVSQGIGELPDLDVVCNSVDAFQGRQADICIYSVVRSNSRGQLGFLRERPRLNVALSRGKSGLVIVGDYLFCRNARGENPFRPVIKYIDEHEETCALEALG